jgi:endoglucanase
MPQSLPNVRVNQLGYLPNRAKRATIVHSATSPLPWQLRDSAGSVVATGVTTVFGHDAASGDHVHTADFSSYTTPGADYRLAVADDVSHAFAINPDLYRQLKYDALAYFYHNRSGIPIEAEFVGALHARPAGHLGIMPNRGDTRVPCAPDTGCAYALDVSGGWYDAGDHGKYVVNGGIAVWTLMHQYERAKYQGDPTALADGALNIPERGNGVPDILDEARWEMDFLLKMQAPEGEPLAGMAHHKVHDDSWTALPMRPEDDPKQRILRPPSTGATLNLAATAAQCARLWQEFDGAYAATCLRAAERAWEAACAHPTVYAPHNDSAGGGPYGDSHLDDEFYWAAAELYVTTGGSAYLQFMRQSPYYCTVPATFGAHSVPAMTWGMTQALGTITLATAPSQLPEQEVAAARQSIVQAANTFVMTLNGQGYRVPFAPGPDGKYPWGSNSFVLNNMIVLALAYDWTQDVVYLDAVVEGLDYLLGRNPLDQSYVSGYGARPLLNPHHRYWARQLDPRYPPVPAGAVGGGPNSSVQDPYAQSVGLQGCAPQKCFVDHISSWSTNEIAINWNAPLAWVTAFLDERGRG